MSEKGKELTCEERDYMCFDVVSGFFLIVFILSLMISTGLVISSCISEFVGSVLFMIMISTATIISYKAYYGCERANPCMDENKVGKEYVKKGQSTKYVVKSIDKRVIDLYNEEQGSKFISWDEFEKEYQEVEA